MSSFLQELVGSRNKELGDPNTFEIHLANVLNTESGLYVMAHILCDLGFGATVFQGNASIYANTAKKDFADELMNLIAEILPKQHDLLQSTIRVYRRSKNESKRIR